MLIASAAPSTGSVPAPSSSMSTSERSSAESSMPTIFFIWLEKVERDCSMLCSSPISANTLSNTANSVPTFAGTNMPDCAIRVKRPIVFSVTVLPPVFGPVMMSVVKSEPRRTSIGTILKLGMSGCLPLTIFILPSAFSFGRTAFISFESFAFAKIRSILPRVNMSV